MIMHHIALNCKDMDKTEMFYTKHFGFQRARVVPLPDNAKIVFLKLNGFYLELFQAEGENPLYPMKDDGHHFNGTRHFAFKVDDVDATVEQLKEDAEVTLGPVGFDDFIPGWKTCWLRDPDGRIIEVSEGFVDQENPPKAEF